MLFSRSRHLISFRGHLIKLKAMIMNPLKDSRTSSSEKIVCPSLALNHTWCPWVLWAAGSKRITREIQVILFREDLGASQMGRPRNQTHSCLRLSTSAQELWDHIFNPSLKEILTRRFRLNSRLLPPNLIQSLIQARKVFSREMNCR